MKKIWKGYRQHKDGVLVFLGLLAVSLIVLPYAVLGEGSYVQVHDQLDGEVLNYIYQARYLGQGDAIPQFMNGMGKASMLPPAPFGVLLYRLLPPFAAYGIMHWFCLTVGFLGMYGLCRKQKLRAEVSWVTACLFCYIPFYPVYGLAALGQPMLVLCALGLREGMGPIAASGRKVLRMGGLFLAVALFAACSSLTLVGYVWVAAGVFYTVCLVLTGWRKKSGYGPALRVAGGTLVLAAVYLACNGDLLRTLGGDGFATHRQEMVLRATEHPLASFRELFFEGGSYSPVYSPGILAAAVLLTLAVLARPTADGVRINIRTVWKLIGLIFCGTLAAVLWNCGPVVSLRLALGGAVTYFQADRVYWCFPFLWMLVLGLVTEGICRLGEQGLAPTVAGGSAGWESGEQAGTVSGEDSQIGRAGNRQDPQAGTCAYCRRGDRAEEHLRTGKIRGGLWRLAAGISCLLLLGIEGFQIFRDSPLNKNVRLMLFDGYRQVTWESIFMEDVFSRIDEAIGQDKADYSVVSLGIYPSVALYHGYICADGYSNNYDLEYKHQFRRIMARELEENPETRLYFDEWGNRLYLAGAPYGINGTVAKGQGGYTDLDYDLDAMESLHIRYLLAAAPVELSSASREQTSLRLELVEGSPFTDDTAYYEVWVYRIDSF